MIFNGFIIRNRRVFWSSTSALSRDSSRSGQIAAMDCNVSASDRHIKNVFVRFSKRFFEPCYSPEKQIRAAHFANCLYFVQPYYPAHFAIFSYFVQPYYAAHFANFPILCSLIMQLFLLILDQIFFAYLRGQAKAFMLLAKFARHN